MRDSGGDKQGSVVDRPDGCLDSKRIFGDSKEVLIKHGDQVYRLRKTRHGKLILNK